MGTLWFCLVALMLIVYVVLDGFDLGAGVVHLFIAQNEDERRTVFRTIGPVWDGNEVWLIAAGGTLYFAFPELYASSFSGFYLPLMMVLWLLILRGISIEFRRHIGTSMWASFWDAVFFLASLLLAIFYGAALGNVVRGVPLDSQGQFFEALWTNFRPSGITGILDWYTILAGIAALLALTVHGALWVALKTEGGLRQRAQRFVRKLWIPLALFTVLITWSSFRLQLHLSGSFAARPWGRILPAIAIAGLLGMIVLLKNEAKAFFASCTYLVGMLASVAFGLYPEVLPSSADPALSLTVENAKAADRGLKIGLAWWIVGMVLATAYFVMVYRRFRGKVDVSREEGY
ncbi:MAG TPA: cytochrome d ubiquinol oxidase subunit II [Candidatus Acidoferrales bacterium]|nr:cytochrome d ubiquinol oxidase subunit II [Candidatus Acidoferrales bacterium]